MRARLLGMAWVIAALGLGGCGDGRGGADSGPDATVATDTGAGCVEATCVDGVATRCDDRSVTLRCADVGGACASFTTPTGVSYGWCDCGSIGEGQASCLDAANAIECIGGQATRAACLRGTICETDAAGALSCACDDRADGVCPRADCVDDPDCGACTPDCAGRACGDNGCGGECGQCSGGRVCTTAGACELPVVDAGVDAGGPVDAGPPDAGTDAGPPDAGTDGGPPDAGPPDAGPPPRRSPCTLLRIETGAGEWRSPPFSYEPRFRIGPLDGGSHRWIAQAYSTDDAAPYPLVTGRVEVAGHAIVDTGDAADRSRVVEGLDIAADGATFQFSQLDTIFEVGWDGTGRTMLRFPGSPSTLEDFDYGSGWLVFYAQISGNGRIFRQPADLSVAASNMEGGSSARVSPDGTRIAVQRSSSLTLNATSDGARLDTITLPASALWTLDWFPDGRHLALLRDTGFVGGTEGLYILDTVTHDLQQVYAASDIHSSVSVAPDANIVGYLRTVGPTSSRTVDAVFLDCTPAL